MSEKLIDKLIKVLHEEGGLDNFITMLELKGYLPGKEEEKPTSIADQTWEVEGYGYQKSVTYTVYNRSGGSKIARKIPTKELADAIAALPNLVKAAQNMVKYCDHDCINDRVECTHTLRRALEKAGEL